jgi:chitodextrinase
MNGTGYYNADLHYNDFGSNSNSDYTAASLPDDFLSQYHVFNTSAAPGNWAERYNGVVYSTHTGGTPWFRPNPNLGCGNLTGDIAEVIVYNRVLTNAERNLVERYLLVKYDTVAPSVPFALAVTGLTEHSVTLSWSASTDNTGVVAYDVYQDGSLVGSSSSPTFTVTGLTGSSTYSMTVRARDAVGNAAALSAAVSFTTLPAVPSGISVINLTANSFMLKWNAPNSDTGFVLYDVYRDGTLIGSPAGSTFVVAGLIPAKLYSMRLRACDASGRVSALSMAVSVTTLPASHVIAMDTDGDGLPDAWELAYGLSPNISDGGGDLDGDGVRNDEDARPNQSAVGHLTVIITTPQAGELLP